MYRTCLLEGSSRYSMFSILFEGRFAFGRTIHKICILQRGRDDKRSREETALRMINLSGNSVLTMDLKLKTIILVVKNLY